MAYDPRLDDRSEAELHRDAREGGPQWAMLRRQGYGLSADPTRATRQIGDHNMNLEGR